MINFLAIGPVVDGKMEFSEISPSKVDGIWGKLLWASDGPEAESYYPTARTRGVVSQIRGTEQPVEELTVYIFMEHFAHGAAPYLKLSIRTDRPEELSIEVFHREGSAQMDRCAITATMGNYPRLRHLHLKDGVVKSTQLYAGFDGIDFIEKESYPIDQFVEDNDGYLWALSTGDETMAQLSAWPDDSLAHTKMNWKYIAPFKLTQNEKKEKRHATSSLSVRLNER